MALAITSSYIDYGEKAIISISGTGNNLAEDLALVAAPHERFQITSIIYTSTTNQASTYYSGIILPGSDPALTYFLIKMPIPPTTTTDRQKSVTLEPVTFRGSDLVYAWGGIMPITLTYEYNVAVVFPDRKKTSKDAQILVQTFEGGGLYG